MDNLLDNADGDKYIERTDGEKHKCVVRQQHYLPIVKLFQTSSIARPCTGFI